MADSQFKLLAQRRFAPFFLTQAFGAFNDNVFKQALIIMIAFKIPGLVKEDIDFWSNLASGLFILPFFLLSANAGQWAEKFEKSRSIRWIKLLEIVIMTLAAIGFWLNSLPFLLGVLFLMGAQSTLFGPIKYSILPQMLKPEELVGGNALIESGTFLAILIGTIVGGTLMGSFVNGPLYASIAILVIAIAGYLSSRAIPPAPAAAPDLVLNWNPITETWHNLQFLRGNRSVLNSVLGVSWFWFFGAMFLAQLPNYTRYYLGGNESVATLVLTLFSLGIGAGSMLCEKLSHRTVEIGLVPLGAIGLTVFGVDLYFAKHSAASVEGSLSAIAFLSEPSNWRIVLDLLLIGVFGGFYIVPLFALIQQRSPRERLSRIVAANNILNALFMVTAAILAIILLSILKFTIPQVLLTTAILNAVVAVYIFTLVPEFLMRFGAWVLTKAMYRLEVKGIEQHVPDEGAALLVCNHVSYMDALILGGAVPRPVKFVMYYKIFNIPVLSWLFRTAGAIPIAGAKENPEMMARAFERIDEALAAGEIVGIFPEGALTRDGEIAEFKSGVEKILERRPVPVVPMALKGMWASMFSKRDSRLARMRVPRRFRANVELEAVAAVSGETADRHSLETIVRGLRGDRA